MLNANLSLQSWRGSAGTGNAIASRRRLRDGGFATARSGREPVRATGGQTFFKMKSLIAQRFLQSLRRQCERAGAFKSALILGAYDRGTWS
jgi:hypothetical protein